jgi:hypothetical protein
MRRKVVVLSELQQAMIYNDPVTVVQVMINAEMISEPVMVHARMSGRQTCQQSVSSTLTDCSA